MYFEVGFPDSEDIVIQMLSLVSPIRKVKAGLRITYSNKPCKYVYRLTVNVLKLSWKYHTCIIKSIWEFFCIVSHPEKGYIYPIHCLQDVVKDKMFNLAEFSVNLSTRLLRSRWRFDQVFKFKSFFLFTPCTIVNAFLENLKPDNRDSWRDFSELKLIVIFCT